MVASSLEKEQVLRKLFDTQLYQDVTDWLKDQAAAGTEALEVLSVKATTVAEHFQWEQSQTATSWRELPDLWQTDLASLQDKISELETAVSSAQAAEKVAEQAFYQGKELQGYFDEQAELDIQAKELAEKGPAILDMQKEIAALTWAQSNQYLLRELDQSQSTCEGYEKQVAASKAQLQLLEEQLAAWEAEKTPLQSVEATLAQEQKELTQKELLLPCLLYTSDAADE